MSPEALSSLHLPHETGPRPVFYPERLPSELFEYAQWVCWRYVDRGPDRKPDKQPVNPHTLGNAGVHWTNTWSSFDQAFSVYTVHQGEGIAGLGFVLTRHDPFVGIDVDDCVEDGEIVESAQELMQRLVSYTEFSPSTRGLRILISCPDYPQNVRTAHLEVYSHSRFLTLTGHHVVGSPTTIASVQKEEIAALTPPPVSAPVEKVSDESARMSATVDNRALWTRIFEHDQYGAQHLRRFQGDTSLDHNNHSFTVIRLLNAIARWTQGDAVKMREMMLLSPLANDKWFSKRGKGDWLDHQIADAIAFVKRGK